MIEIFELPNSMNFVLGVIMGGTFAYFVIVPILEHVGWWPR